MTDDFLPVEATEHTTDIVWVVIRHGEGSYWYPTAYRTESEARASMLGDSASWMARRLFSFEIEGAR